MVKYRKQILDIQTHFLKSYKRRGYNINKYLEKLYKYNSSRYVDIARNREYRYFVEDDIFCTSLKYGTKKNFLQVVNIQNIFNDIVKFEFNHYENKLDYVKTIITKGIGNDCFNLHYKYNPNATQMISIFSLLYENHFSDDSIHVSFQNLDDYLEILNYPVFDDLAHLHILS